MLGTASCKFSFILPSSREHFARVNLGIAEHRLSDPVIDGDRVLIVLADREQLLAARAEGEL